jgi:hypothetical protein
MSQLPPVPVPPAMPDPVAGEALLPGYPPSAPDLARIQDAMRAALAPIPPPVLKQAWRREGVAWGWEFLKTWVRGLRRADLDLHGGHLDVRFCAAGPGGLYDFAFSVRLRG